MCVCERRKEHLDIFGVRFSFFLSFFFQTMIFGTQFIIYTTSVDMLCFKLDVSIFRGKKTIFHRLFCVLFVLPLNFCVTTMSTL